MTTLTEGKYPGEFILSEANCSRSRETGTLVLGQNLSAGAVLGIITASGKLAAYDNDAVDGTQTAAGILFDNVDATAADVAGVVYFARDAEVRKSDLAWKDTDAETAGTPQLKTLGIIVRNR